MSIQIPKSVQAVLWSYDLSKIDIHKHKKIIISQVLNFGSEEATNWLFGVYDKQEIVDVAESIPLGQWDRKSLALWSLCLGIHPRSRADKILYG